MKIIDATWEMRNLGITTQEVEIEDKDTLTSIENGLRRLNATYQVIKTSCAQMDVYALLSRLGFSFVEASIRVSHNLKNINCPIIVKRISDNISFEIMKKYDYDIMISQIKKGMFRTDRVFLDSYFTPAQASNRYIHWIMDEIGRNSRLYTYKYKNEPVGFSCMKEARPNVYYPILGGVYLLEKTLPIGSALIYKQLEIVKSLEGKELYTFISSNNPAVIKSYSQLGYIFGDIKYVFIKHVDCCE